MSNQHPDELPQLGVIGCMVHDAASELGIESERVDFEVSMSQAVVTVTKPKVTEVYRLFEQLRERLGAGKVQVIRSEKRRR